MEFYATNPDTLEHYGVKGMKWGVRRYQNPDGTLTPKGIAKNKKGRMDRKVLKDVGRRMQKSDKKHTMEALDSIKRDFDKNNIHKNFVDYSKNVKITYDSYGRPVSTKFTNNATYSEYAKLYWKNQAAKATAIQKGSDAIASGILNDIGYEDTNSGREYIKRILEMDKYSLALANHIRM